MLLETNTSSIDSGTETGNVLPGEVTKMRKYAMERFSRNEMSALDNGFEPKREQRKLSMMSSNPSTYGIFIPVPTQGDSQKHPLLIVGWKG